MAEDGDVDGGVKPGDDKNDQDPPPDDEHKDGGEEMIPRSRLVAALRNQEEKHARLLAQAVAASQPRGEEPRKQQQDHVFTRKELLAFVDDGKMSLDQADTYWEQQIIARATSEARRASTAEVSTREVARRVDAEMRRYKDLVPGVMTNGSSEREKVAAEYQYLVSIGQPDTRETELAALRVVYGPVDRLEAKRKPKTPVENDPQSGGGDAASRRDQGGDPLKGLTPRERDYYDGRIKSGAYKDWAAVKEELKFAKADLRKKMGAKA